MDVKPNEDNHRIPMSDTDQAFMFFNEINIIAQLSTNRFERMLPEGLTSSQFSVLNWFVRVDTEATPGRLATAFMVTRGAMTNTLKKLEQKGLVRIEPDETSGRQKRVTMTSAGRHMRDAAIKACGPQLDSWIGAIPWQEVEVMLPTLRRIRAYLDEERYRN